MGKSDQKKTQAAITTNTAQNKSELGAGINESGSRVNELTTRSDAERANILNNYDKFNRSTADNYRMGGGSGGSSGGGGGGGGDAAPAQPEDYVGVWNELMGKEGGFDPNRLANVTKQTSNLNDYAARGGITDADRGNVNRDTLLDFEKTGGYSAGDLANIRARSNAAVPAAYQNLSDSMNRRRAVNNMGPGFDKAGFKLMRQSAQDQGAQARDTELGISDAVRSGRLDASKFLSGQNLSLADLTSKNQLAGYQASSANDMNLQNSINQARLGASTSKGQDARSREAIAAQSAAAGASRAQAAEMFAQEMSQRDRMFGASGDLSTYGTGPQELEFNQNLQRGYRNDMVNANNSEINNRIGASYIPGIGSTISKGIGIAGQIAGMGAGGFNPFNFGGGAKNASASDFQRYGGFGGNG